MYLGVLGTFEIFKYPRQSFSFSPYNADNEFVDTFYHARPNSPSGTFRVTPEIISSTAESRAAKLFSAVLLEKLFAITLR